MAEMKRPWDFWKAFLCAQTIIVVLYVFFDAIANKTNHVVDPC